MTYSKNYYLCGSDEDGCYDYDSCACIPQSKANEAFCLDFDNLVCLPLEKKPNCPKIFIYQEEGECLAAIFQSEPRPACPLVSIDFCLENHIVLCDEGGDVSSCH